MSSVLQTSAAQVLNVCGAAAPCGPKGTPPDFQVWGRRLGPTRYSSSADIGDLPFEWGQHLEETMGEICFCYLWPHAGCWCLA